MQTARAMPAAIKALIEPIATRMQEMAIFVYLDSAGRVLGMRHTPSGGPDQLMVPVRDVVADALAFDAASVIMAHNHPSGNPAPSTADYALTRRLARALNSIDVRLLDHIVLARDGCESFRNRGLL